MTGTEGYVYYRLQGVRGQAYFHWNNPFYGSNSASDQGPAGYVTTHLGNHGNRTVVFFEIHHAGTPWTNCNARWVLSHVGTKPEPYLSGFDEVSGFLTTPLKRLGFGGWVDTGCFASATGTLVRTAQHSTDGFWTIDMGIRSMKIGSRAAKHGRFVRIEVEPHTPAHAGVNGRRARGGQTIMLRGRVLIDTHHGEELIEIHPYSQIKYVATPKPPPAAKRPIYVFTHNLNSPGEVAKAMRAGYNAIEPDAWYGKVGSKTGWWAAEIKKGRPTEANPSPLVDVLAQMHKARKSGKNLAFVWLDLKEMTHTNPDIAALKRMVHAQLTGAGIPVMYQFYPGDPGSRAWNTIKQGLGPHEGISIEADYGTVQAGYKNNGKGIRANHRLMDKGLDDQHPCNDANLNDYKKGVQDRAKGKLQRVFAFTVTNLTPCIDKLLRDVGLDGLIAGDKAADYTDVPATRKALTNITGWLHHHKTKYRLACTGDNPYRSVPGRCPPNVRITFPSNNYQLWRNALVRYTASVSEPNGDRLPATSIKWTEDGIKIGQGPAIVHDEPTVGTHLIKVTATNSEGGSASDSTYIRVNPLTATSITGAGWYPGVYPGPACKSGGLEIPPFDRTVSGKLMPQLAGATIDVRVQSDAAADQKYDQIVKTAADGTFSATFTGMNFSYASNIWNSAYFAGDATHAAAGASMCSGIFVFPLAGAAT